MCSDKLGAKINLKMNFYTTIHKRNFYYVQDHQLLGGFVPQTPYWGFALVPWAPTLSAESKKPLN